MVTIYWFSIWIGIVFGFFIGVAITVSIMYLIDKKLYSDDGAGFERGFNRGWDCGKEHQENLQI